MSDANLRQIFQRYLALFHWQSVETWSTGRGVPDLNYCHQGIEGWLELKRTTGWRVNVSAEQVGWIERRLRHGGRVFIAVRRLASAGPRRGAATDELHLFPGSAARQLLTNQRPNGLGCWPGGPARWDWPAISAILLK